MTCSAMVKWIFALVAPLMAWLPTAAGDGPTMGWSSWNTYRVNISDSLIMKQADAMVSTGLMDAGYSYVNIDDGYFGGRAADGQLLIHPVRFAGGLEPVVEHIHALGLKAGIYSDAGRNTCGNFYDNDSVARGVGFYGHDDADADLFFRKLGFDFIKIDFCGGSPHQNTDSLKLDERERYAAISEAIKRTGRDDVRLNICRWDFPGTWAGDVAFSWRISHDIAPHWESVKDIIGQNLYLSAYCRDGHYNDMDMLEVGRTLTPDEDVTHFGLWCMMSSPLLIGCDLTTVKPQTLSLLKNPELIAVNQDPLHLQAYVTASHDGCHVMVKDVIEKYGLTRVFAVYNPTDMEKRVRVCFRDLDLAGKVSLRDLVEREDVGVYGSGYVVDVPPHATKIYMATATERLDRLVYEAETAFIGNYQELCNNQVAKSGIYEPDDRCSGGMKAAWLGGSPDNYLLWDNVYVSESGDYDVVIHWMADTVSSALLEVNGDVVADMELSGSEGLGKSETMVRLNKGENTIRLLNPESRMPDVDFMHVMRHR